MRTVFLLMLWLCSFSIFAASELTVFDHSGQKHGFSREQLLSLPQKEITTTLPWVEGLTVYSGVTLQTVLENMDLPISSQVTFVALMTIKLRCPKKILIPMNPSLRLKRMGSLCL